MTLLLGIALFAGAGYSLALLLGLCRKNLLHDIALGWFIGAGYYTVVMALLSYKAGVQMNAAVSLSVIIFPVLILLFRLKSHLPYLKESWRNTKLTKQSSIRKVNVLDAVLVCYIALVFLVIIIHGSSTPTNADDALELRAYTPVLIYENNFTENANFLILQNGFWNSFVTVLFWHIGGGVDQFYVNYTILTSLFFFLSLLYLVPATRGNSKHGLYNVFLVLSMPLFIYHSTITYADIRLAMPFALGFLFFSFYVRDLDNKDLNTSIVFFIITCLVKSKGLIMGITGLTVCMAYSIFVMVRNKKISVKRVTLYALLIITLSASVFLQGKYYVPLSEVLANLPERFTSSSADEMGIVALQSLVYGGQADSFSSPLIIKFWHFFTSLFYSGNFGILFYVLSAAVLVNMRKIFSTTLFWETLFIAIVTLETYVYMVLVFDISQGPQNIIHRTNLLLAVVSSVYLASLWSAIKEPAARKQKASAIKLVHFGNRLIVIQPSLKKIKDPVNKG